MKGVLGEALNKAGLPLVAALPHNPLISSVRLDEICAALGTALVSGGRGQRDLTVDKVCAPGRAPGGVREPQAHQIEGDPEHRLCFVNPKRVLPTRWARRSCRAGAARGTSPSTRCALGPRPWQRPQHQLLLNLTPVYTCGRAQLSNVLLVEPLPLASMSLHMLGAWCTHLAGESNTIRQPSTPGDTQLFLEPP